MVSPGSDSYSYSDYKGALETFFQTLSSTFQKKALTFYRVYYTLDSGSEGVLLEEGEKCFSLIYADVINARTTEPDQDTPFTFEDSISLSYFTSDAARKSTTSYWLASESSSAEAFTVSTSGSLVSSHKLKGATYIRPCIALDGTQFQINSSTGVLEPIPQYFSLEFQKAADTNILANSSYILNSVITNLDTTLQVKLTPENDLNETVNLSWALLQ